MIEKLLNEDLIDINVEVKEWSEAVRVAGNILLKNNKIEQEYIEAMISTVKELGPYIVMAPGVAMPHGRPESGVYETGISIITLNRPIDFGNEEFDPVKIVFAICANENKAHIDLLKDLSIILDHDKLVEECGKCETKSQLIKLLIEIYNNN